MRAKNTLSDAVVIDWDGAKTTVDDEKVRSVIQGWRNTEKDLVSCQAPKEKVYLIFNFAKRFVAATLW